MMIKHIKKALCALFIFSHLAYMPNINAAEAENQLTDSMAELSVQPTPQKPTRQQTEEIFSPGGHVLEDTEPQPAPLPPRVGEILDGSIKFYNMGNGNAILVLIRGRPPLICDAGSVCYPPGLPRNQAVGLLTTPLLHDLQNFYANGHNINPAHYGNAWPLSICISHPSCDHFNFIHDIITRLRINDPTPLNIHTMLGGYKEDYMAARCPGRPAAGVLPAGQQLLGTLDAQRLACIGEDDPLNDDDYMRFTANRLVNRDEEINWLLHRYDYFQAEPEQHPRWYGDAHVTHLIGQRDLNLNLPIGGDADNHDAKSIVTRVRIDNWTLLTQGDAVVQTTNAIIGQFRHEDLQSDIYHASLQGGGLTQRRDRANRQEWIQFINPQFGVMTAGSHAGHQAPKAEVIRRFFYRGNRLVNNQPIHHVHYFNPYYGTQHPPFNGIAPTQYIDGFLGRTSYGIYTTFSSGSIEFMSQNPVQPVVQYPGVNLPVYLP